MFSRFVEWEFEWKEKGAWMRQYTPKLTKLRAFRHFNFIILHYMYMLFWVIAGSVMIYGPRNMDYIDALFFASGATTQSGLNTINVNDITTYQQVTIVLISCITNPIFINTMVVLIRLYWFEKRFQHVVQDAVSWRRSRTRSKGRSELTNDPEHDRAERGVGNRQITVIRGPNGHAGSGKGKESESDSDIAVAPAENHVGSDAGADDEKSDESIKSPTFHRDIMWADQVRPSRAEHVENQERLPQSRTQEENIKFLEKQRQGEKTKLRVPGPRDFDRGELPQQVYDDEELGRTISHHDSPEAGREKRSGSHGNIELNADDNPMKEEHKGGRHINWTPNISNMLPHRSKTSLDDENSNTLRKRGRTGTFQSFFSARSEERDPMPYLSYAPTVGRNSLFVDLTEEQREELGGVEYRSLKTLAWILCFYYIGFHLFGIVSLVPWIETTRWATVVAEDGQSVVWWGIFTPMSMFTDLGFTLTPDSMISFQYAIFPLLLGSFLIVIGNTGFPCMLRFVIWAAQKVVSYGTPLYEELSFLLDHPRRCFTLLFPRQATWWLFAILVILNAIDIIFFIILDLNDDTITVLPPGIRFVDGIFQAFSTRTAGFAVVNLAELHPAIQVSYLIMMYISVFPIAISVRRTNVYEEKSLGIYPQDSEDDDAANGKTSYVGAHLRRQLSFDLWFVFLGLFIICIVEGDHLQSTDDYAFTVFAVLFEIVSAYGTVGLSLGYPGVDTSFSGQFRVISKLVIIAMQIRGRHRGLPYALDRAILLPSESLQRKEAEEAAKRQGRRMSTMSAVTIPPGEDDATSGGLYHVPQPGDGVRSRRFSANDADGSGRRATLSEHFDLMKQGNGLRKIVSGALSAGPSVRKSKKDS